MADIYIIEENTVWQDTKFLTELLAKAKANPFVNFEEMYLNYALKGQPYSSKKALATLAKNNEPAVTFRTETPFYAEATISKGTIRNNVYLVLENEALRKVEVKTLLSYLREIACMFPQFGRIEIRTDYKLKEFYQREKLNRVPACFGDYVGWYYLISPLAYEPYYTRAELLAVPAHQVRELDNSWIEIISYPDPLSYDQPQPRERIIEITDYLNAHRHDRVKTPVTV